LLVVLDRVEDRGLAVVVDEVMIGTH
jgi:hypothetical protein